MWHTLLCCHPPSGGRLVSRSLACSARGLGAALEHARDARGGSYVSLPTRQRSFSAAIPARDGSSERSGCCNDTSGGGPPLDAMWPSTRALLSGVLARDRGSLARSITLVESQRSDHQAQAELLLAELLSRRSAAFPLAAAAPTTFPAAGAAATPSPPTVPVTTDASASAAATTTEADDDASSTTHPFPPLPPGGLSHPRPPTLRVGVAGPPGAGKSTVIEALGLAVLSASGSDPGAPPHSVAVIAVDPSSCRTGGSILGDKTRMPELSKHPRAYVRASPTRGALGGLAAHTNDVILLCESAGFDVVLVETVGLGQSEVVVDSAVDVLLLVLPPAGGDELQGVKKGIMEVADIVVVNKADGALAPAARHAAADVRRALQVTRWKHPQWPTQVLTASALTDPPSVGALWGQLQLFWARMGGLGVIRERRRAQSLSWMWAGVDALLAAAVRRDPGVRAAAEDLSARLADGGLSPRVAASTLAAVFREGEGGRAAHAQRAPAVVGPASVTADCGRPAG